MENINILVVDDNVVNLDLIAEILKSVNYNCVLEENGFVAIEKANAGNFDLIILDVMMPDIDGFTVCRAIRKSPNNIDTPIIFLTARTDSRSLLEGFEAGAVDYIRKPFGQQELLARVATHIELQHTKITLKNNLHFLETLLNTIPNPIFYKDSAGVYQGCNQTFASQIFGLPIDQIVGYSLEHFAQNLTPELLKVYREKDLELLNNLGSQQYESKVACNDNVVRDFHFSKAVYNDVQQRPSGIVGVMVDFTERKQMEIALKQSEAQLSAIIENTNNSILSFDRDGRIVFFNDAFRRLYQQLHYSEPVAGVQFATFMPIHQHNICASWIARVNQGQHFFEEIQYTTVDGTDFYYSIWFNPIFLEQRIVGGASLIIDITEQKKSQIELRISEEKFRNIFNLSTDAIVITTLQGDCLNINLEFERLSGYTKDELIAQKTPIAKIVTGISAVCENLCHNNHDNQINIESEIIAKDAHQIPIEIKAAIIQYENQASILANLRDITDRKQMHSKILSTIIKTEEKERNRFAKDLHDGLGALLSSINIYLNLLELGKIDQNELPSIIADMKNLLSEAVLSSKEIANNILPNVLTNYGLIAGIKSFVEKLNNTGSVKVNFDHSKLTIKIEQDVEIVFFRIINELINNTLKHAIANNIHIDLLNESRTIRLNYTDDGIGFDVNKKLNQNSDNNLGLQNIYSRVKSLAGTIDISSTPLKGISVHIEIPVL